LIEDPLSVVLCFSFFFYIKKYILRNKTIITVPKKTVPKKSRTKVRCNILGNFSIILIKIKVFTWIIKTRSKFKVRVKYESEISIWYKNIIQKHLKLSLNIVEQKKMVLLHFLKNVLCINTVNCFYTIN